MLRHIIAGKCPLQLVKFTGAGDYRGLDPDTNAPYIWGLLCHRDPMLGQELVEAVLRAGADINERDPQGRSLLLFAAERGDWRLLRRLLALPSYVLFDSDRELPL